MLAGALALLAAGCLPAQAGGIWRRGEQGNPGSLDPHKVSNVLESRILGELYEGLTVADENARLKPGVAERWDISTDRRVYTFYLRGNARWSNGAPVTAEDFVYAFRRLMDPKTGAQYASILYDVKNARAVNQGKMPLEALGVRAVDAKTFEITLEHPVAYLLEQLAHFTAYPLYRPSVDTWGMGFARPGRMVGNGAFVLESYTPNDKLVFKKSPTFHDAAHVALDGEIMFPLEDQSAALRRFMAGEIDSYSDVPADQIAFVRKTLGEELKVAPNLGSYFFGFDTRQKPFDDVRVRQALSMVVDREFLARAIWGGTMAASYSFVPPGIPSYGAPATVRWKDESAFQREDEAKRLMREAGFGPGHPLHLTYRFNQSENHQRTAVAIADMWKVLGVTTELVVSDATTYFAILQSGRPYDVIRGSWYADYPDAQNYLFLAETDNKVLNYVHFSDPAYDALMRRAAGEADPAARSQTLHAAEKLLLAEQPYLVLMSYEAANLVSPKLHGWHTNFIDHHPGRYISIDP